MTGSADSLERIRKALEDPRLIDGPWVTELRGGDEWYFGDGEITIRVAGAPTWESFAVMSAVGNEANAEWIAAANPVAIRSLLAREAALREAVTRLLVLARLAGWEGDEAAIFARAALASTEPTKD